MSEHILSHYQQAVVTFVIDGEGNLVISAVAGSGKSWIIIYICRFIPRGALSIFLAFNRHIIAELKKRLPDNVEARTCHSLGYGPCIDNAPDRKLQVDSDDPKHYRDKYGDIIHAVVEREFKPADWEKKRYYNSALQKLIDFSRNTLNENTIASLEQMASAYNIEIKEPKLYHYVQEILNRGISVYKATGAIDFTDMIWLPIVLNMSMRKFDYILVDEFQDLNALQHELIFRSCHPKTRLFVVGDPMQSMYGFTGAMIGSMDVFREKASATQLPLSICYRCARSFITIARYVDGNRTEPSPYAEEGLVEFILNDDIHKYVQAKDLILSRTTAPLLRICIRLISQKISAKVLGRNIGKQLVEVIDAAMSSEEGHGVLTWGDFPSLLDALERGMSEKLGKQRGGEKLVEMYQDKTQAIRACYNSPDFDTSSQANFVKQLTGLFSEDMSPITLCTVHRAKGLEADNVFIVCDQGEKDIMPLIWPRQEAWELEQEINICYVALTRAKKTMRFCSSTKEASARHVEKYLNGGIRDFVHNAPKPIPLPPSISVTESVEEEVTIIATKTKKKKKKVKTYLMDI